MMSRLKFARVPLAVAAGLAGAFAFAIAAAGSAPANLDSLPADSGIVGAFAFDTRAPGSVYAATIEGRVYKTTDAGGQWVDTTTGLDWSRVDALVADPRRPATLYAGTGEAVYKTVNGGRSWQGADRGLLPPPPVLAPGQVTGTPGWRRAEGWVGALAVDPSDRNIIYAGTGGGVKKSADGGRTWRTVLWRGRYMFIAALVIAPMRPQVVYAAAYIVAANCGAPGRPSCGGSALLYKSANGGKTWRRTGLRRANPKGNFAALALDQQRPTTLYAAIGSSVLKSTDAGRSWRSMTHGFSGRNVNSLAADPRRSGTVYAGSWGAITNAGSSGGVFKTTNGGVTWRRVSPGVSVYVLAVDPAHPATIYAGVNEPDYRILRSTDSGGTWAIAG
jgi:photosystem II stability/assembly factor-like uncharacterized protein